MENKKPQIIFQDEDVLIINKPAGMIVNRADTARHKYTVQDWIEEEIKSLKLTPIQSELKVKSSNDSDFEKRSGIVHRLDKETSGVLIIAKSESSFENLQKQFRSSEVQKVYVALCHGKMVEEGLINVPIGRLPWNRMRFGVLPEGRESRTNYKVLEYRESGLGPQKETLSLVEVYPETGRTHQIRVHFQYVGHPIFADALYAGRKVSTRDRKRLSRHFLHATKITFQHPRTNERVTFESPLPEELKSFVSKLVDTV